MKPKTYSTYQNKKREKGIKVYYYRTSSICKRRQQEWKNGTKCIQNRKSFNEITVISSYLLLVTLNGNELHTE